uniref:Polyketide synthase n=1 Tax=Dirinaria applanata TaxID=205617 RepID=B5LPD0_9LECA|nr:polyketide synthase [Dirinaria applanata]
MSDELSPSGHQLSGELRVLLFGDQALDTRAFIRSQLIVGRTIPLLCIFFDRITLALRREISELSPLERKYIPAFSNIDELTDRTYSQQHSHPGVESALLCISQLAQYFDQVVLIAFRTGLCAGTSARSLELSQDRTASWSTIVTGTNDKDALAAISEFHKQKVEPSKIPKSKHAYISAVSKTTVTISGPPNRYFRPIVRIPLQSGITTWQIPIHAPYHAPHLHKSINAKRIVGCQNARVKAVLDRYSPVLPVMSTSTGRWFSPKMTTTEILTEIIHDILNEPLRLYQVLNGCAEYVNDSKVVKCRVVCCGPTTAETGLVTALRSETHADIILHEEGAYISSPLRLNQTPRSSKKPKLAIVGMAGRFPNAADHEKFWDLLYAGLDVHREHKPYSLWMLYRRTGSLRPSLLQYVAPRGYANRSYASFGLASAYEALEMPFYRLRVPSLWAGECDTAVAGGLNVVTNSDIFAGLSREQFLSKTGNCQTYDNDADGYCRGDGIGTIILKRLEDAEADNDRILGVILETMTNHSSNAVSITHPHAPTQEDLFQKVMDDAGVDPHDVNYVEMHGTGTQAGDGTEMRSVTNVFAPPSRKGTRAQSLHLGTVKSNVGHGEAVSGVTAMIKCLLMMQKSIIPPHCGIKKTINQGFPQDLMARNVHIAFKPTPLISRNGSPRRIFVNNFSAAGGNTALLLEDAPERPAPSEDPRSEWVVSVCAKSKSALRNNVSRLIQFIDSHPVLRIADLSYTTTARRIQHNYRIAFSCESVAKAREILSSKLDVSVDPVSTVQPSVAFVYTGQGSHYTALANQLYEYSNSFRSEILHFNDISCGLGFPSFLPPLDGSIDAKELPPVVVQVGICCIQMALTALWTSWGLKPGVVMGHSLGEYAALNASGVLSTADTIYLVGERARLLEERCTANSHAMIATKSSVKHVQDIVADLAGAWINGPQETVLSGTVADVDQAVDRLASHGVKCTKLNVLYAFHSSQVDTIMADFESKAGSVRFNKPDIPIISPLLATVLSEEDSINAHYLGRHAREVVNFSGALAAAQQLGLINVEAVWVEIGPHPVCLSFVKTELGQGISTVPSLRKDAAPYRTIAGSLAALHTAGLVIDWNEYHRDFLHCVRMLDLPTYAFDNKNYWIQYTGDRNLTKGQVSGLTLLPEAITPSISTTTVQKVISESVEKDRASMVIESDISRPDLLAAISGHLVNGTALRPSSIYGDMALTVCNYLYKLLRPNLDSIGMNVCHMEVFKPFIADEGGKGQSLRLSTNVDLSVNRAVLVFSSGTGKTEVQHAKCHVEFGSEAVWLDEWQRTAYLIRGRTETLMASASTGKAHRMLRGMAYKLFAALVDYDPKYRGMEEAILDSPLLEATSHVNFQTTESDGNFFCSPYWIDSVAHLAGCVVSNDSLDSSKQVYISHGGNMMAGDVYVFDGDRIVGMVGALKFRCIPRQLLNTFLPPKGAATAVAKAAPAKKPSPSVQIMAPPKTKKAAVKVTALPKTGPSVTVRTLDIIAGEVGMPPGELADAIEFADIGVDSLMSLSITGRIREELEIEVPSSEDMSAAIRNVISSEMGVDISELLAAGDLASLGMDSLMSLTILGELREKTGLSLPADFLIDNNSIKAIEKALASSVLLQGMPKVATKTLWLIPDGSGSATSYIFMPDIGKDVAVYGLNSPFMKTPEEYDCGVWAWATYFIEEIKRRRPQGPYSIGGWSAGGVISYETVRQLIEAGDEVDLLALIDTPCPLIIEPPPSSLHRWFGSIGLLGEGDGALDKLPPWLLPHFAASVTALSTYETKKIPPGKTPPKVFAIWCEDGVCKYPEDPRPDPYPYGHAQWLLENRTDFGPNLWDEYLEKDNIQCRSMAGNHFSMMRAPLVDNLSKFLREALN